MERAIFPVWENSVSISTNPITSRYSLAIVFSVSGESRDTIRHTTRFKEQNCQILSITNTENCTIAKISDYNIAYYITYMKIADYDVTSQLPAMSIAERLGKKIYRRTGGHLEIV